MKLLWTVLVLAAVLYLAYHAGALPFVRHALESWSVRFDTGPEFDVTKLFSVVLYCSVIIVIAGGLLGWLLSRK